MTTPGFSLTQTDDASKQVSSLGLLGHFASKVRLKKAFYLFILL